MANTFFYYFVLVKFVMTLETRQSKIEYKAHIRGNIAII